ncbi:MAG: VOC family protein, partial [Spirochaetota bacterium]
MKNPVVHWEISFKDYKKGKEFYSQLFDWNVEEMDMGGTPYGMVNADPVNDRGIGGGLMPKSPDARHGFTTFYVFVDDVTAYLKKVEKLGGKTVIPRTPIPNTGYYGLFTDP